MYKLGATITAARVMLMLMGGMVMTTSIIKFMIKRNIIVTSAAFGCYAMNIVTMVMITIFTVPLAERFITMITAITIRIFRGNMT